MTIKRGEPLTHEAADDRGLAGRYVAGKLTDPREQDLFEAHLLTCEQCQQEVTLGLAVREEFKASVTPPRRRWIWGGVGAVAAVVAGVLLWFRPSPAIRALGGIAEPPVYLGVSVRTEANSGDSLFAAAMDAYTARDYDRAAAGLSRAVAAGADSAASLFFLGACELVREHPQAARDALRRVIQHGNSPYLPEAHFYLAKSLLKIGDSAEALRELAAVSPATTLGPAARVLADSVRAMSR